MLSILKKIGLTASGKERWPDKIDTKHLSGEELRAKYKNACHFLSDHLGAANLGDFLEFGISRGTSLHCMFQTLKKLKIHNVRICAFDAFDGLPAIDLIKKGWQPEAFVDNIEFTTRILKYKNLHWARILLIKGWHNETLTDNLKTKHNIKKASLIKIDCNDCHSINKTLNFCNSLIKDTSIVFFRQWLNEDGQQKKACEEFLEENSHLKIFEFDSFNSQYGKIFVIANNGGVTGR